MVSSMSGARNGAPEDKFAVLQRKGALPILLQLLEGEKTFSELRDQADLSNGTTQRRLEDLEEVGWIEEQAMLNASGQAVKVYSLSEDVQQAFDGLRDILNQLGVLD